MDHKPTVGVIGAGIVGISCALHLLRLGRKVIVLDRDRPAAGASYGNGGVLACCAVVPVMTPGVLRRAPRMLLERDAPLFLRWSYLPRLMPWLLPYLRNARRDRVERIARALTPLLYDSVAEHRALAADSAAARRIQASSYLFLYPHRAAFEADRFAWDLRAAAGFNWEVLEGGAVQECEPAITRACGCAIRLHGHGLIVSPGDYVTELAEQVVRLGGKVQRDEVVALQPRAKGVSIITRGGRADGLEVDAVVIANGAWSGPLGRRFGANVPLQSERGYHLHFRAAEGAPSMPLMYVQRKVAVTPMDGDLRFAGIVEFGGLSAGPQRAPLRMLRRTARQLLPNLRAAPPQEWLGHRPATTDSLPLLGVSPRHRRVFFACGHQHIGLTAGPKSGRLVAEMVCGREVGIPMAAYRVERGGIITTTP